MKLNEWGKIVERIWKELPHRFYVTLDEFVVMPNHIHGIIVIMDKNVGAPLVGAQYSKRNTGRRAGTRPAPTLGQIVGAFKSIVVDEYIRGVKKQGWKPFNGKIWQRDYFERIIRNEAELLETRQYIRNNPLKWQLDLENPNFVLIQGRDKSRPYNG